MSTTEKPVVLVVDDDRDLLKVVTLAFEADGYRVVTATDFKKAIRVIHQTKGRMLAFVDININGEKNGFDILEYISRVASQRVVAYAWTGEADSLRRKAVKVGAIHAYRKPLNLDDLLVNAESDVARNLVENATTDSMTGLLNFRTFKMIVSIELKNARARKRPAVFSAIMVDVNKFKEINDEHGHVDGGDRALKRIAEVIQTHVRPAEHPCRYGGDEFLIWLPEADRRRAKKIIERLKAEVARTPIGTDEGGQIFTTISCGHAQLTCEDIHEDVSESLMDLINRADAAMYADKPKGALVGAE